MNYAFGIPTLPSTPPVKLNFYNPFTMQVNGSTTILPRVTKSCNYNGKTVEITGESNTVDDVISKLNGVATVPATPQNNQFFPIGTPLQAMLPQNQPASQVRLQLPGLQNVNTQPVVFPGVSLPPLLVLPGMLLVNTARVLPIGTNAQGWEFIANPLNANDPLLSHPSLQKPFSGSGVLFFEKSYNGRPTVVLAKHKNGVFHDIGGKISQRISPSQDTVKDNARKEALEESQGLFAIENITIGKFVDLFDGANNANYRCYLVALGGTDRYPLDQWYLNNKNILDKVSYLSNAWRETDDLQRFYLQDIINALTNTQQGQSMQCKDVNGVVRTLRNRTVNIFRLITPDLVVDVLKNPATTRYTQDRTIGSSTYGIVRITM